MYDKRVMNHSLWVPDELADGDEHPTDVAS